MTQLERGARISPTTPALAPGDDARTHGPRTQRTHKRTVNVREARETSGGGARSNHRFCFIAWASPAARGLLAEAERARFFAARDGRLFWGVFHREEGLRSASSRLCLARSFTLSSCFFLSILLSPSFLERTAGVLQVRACLYVCIRVCVCLRLCARLLVRACPEARGGAGSGAAPSSSSS